MRRQRLPDEATDAQQSEERSSNGMKGLMKTSRTKAGTERSASARHAHRERHVRSRH